MTGSKVDNSKLNARQRRLVFRAWHRGIREMDLVFGQYVDAHIMKLDEKAMDKLCRYLRKTSLLKNYHNI